MSRLTKPVYNSEQSNSPYEGPFDRGPRLLRTLRAILEADLARQLTFDEIGSVCGVPKSTVFNWFNGEGHAPPETLLRLMEKIPVTKRHELLDSPPFCRVHPVVDHPRLLHDPTAVSQLKTMLRRGAGTIIVRGEENVVTFLVTALGHTFRAVHPVSSTISGLDRHAPDWFVPIPGVVYLNNELDVSRLKKFIDSLSAGSHIRPATLLLLNGVCSCVEPVANLLKRATPRMTVIGERQRLTGGPLQPIEPVQEIFVRCEPNIGGRLRLDFGHKNA